MTRERCHIPGCVIRNSTNRKKLMKEGIRISLFSLPRDPKLLEEWKKVFSEKNMKLSGSDCVCELHFQPDEVQKFHFCKLSDGTVRKHRKGKVTLKSGAIPSRFPNVSSSSVKSPNKSSKDDSEENLLKMRKAYPTRSKKIKDNIENTDLNAEQEENVSFVKDSFTYHELCEKLHLVKKPNNWWGITLTDNCIICARWNNKYDVEKRVIIESNLKAKYIKHLKRIIKTSCDSEKMKEQLLPFCKQTVQS